MFLYARIGPWFYVHRSYLCTAYQCIGRGYFRINIITDRFYISNSVILRSRADSAFMSHVILNA